MKLLTYFEIDPSKILVKNEDKQDILQPVINIFHHLNNFYCYSTEDLQNNNTINYLIEISKTKTMIKIN